MRATSGLMAILGFGNIVVSQSGTPTVDLSTRAINAPLNCNEDYTYMGYHSFDLSTPFSAQRCAEWCNGTSQFNLEHPPQNVLQPPQLCRFYNTYILVNNTVPQEQICAMYTQAWDPTVHAVNSGYIDGGGNNLTISSSVFSSNTTAGANPICPADIRVLSEDRVAGAFCRSVISYTGTATSATAVATTTRTETVKACRPTGGAARLFRVRRADGNDPGVQGVAAFYPEKYNATTTGDPVLVTIPSDLLLSSGVYAAATSLAVDALASVTLQITDSGSQTPDSLVVSLTRDVPAATDSVISTSTTDSGVSNSTSDSVVSTSVTDIVVAISTATSTSALTLTLTSTSASITVSPSVKSQSTPIGSIVKRQVGSIVPEVVSSVLQAILPTSTTSVSIVVVTSTSVMTPDVVVVVTATSVVTPIPVVVVTATSVVAPPSVAATTLSVVASASSSASSVSSVISTLVGSPLSTIAATSSSTTSSAASSTALSPTSTSSISSTSSVSSTSSASTTSQALLPTPPIFAGREAREIASVCSRVVTGTTGTEEAVATVTDYSDCNLHPTTCDDGTSSAQLIAGSFTNSTEDIDDTYYQVDLDFPICIYDDCSTRVFPSTNGLISLGTQNVGINDYVNRLLPAENGLGVLSAFWDDLYIHKGEAHYMDYAVCGPNGTRTVTFDWRMGRYNAPSDGPLYSWSATFYEDSPSRIFLKYFNTTDQGASATVGVEGKTNGTEQSFQYSFDQAIITDGLGLVFDPRKGYFGQAQLEPNAR